MLQVGRRACLSSLRSYSTSQPPKPSIKLVAELRKLTEVSISKARDALTASNNDVAGALEWLQKDLVTTGAAKAAKVEGRVAAEGLISVSVLSEGAGTGQGGPVRASMVELNCETDFVGRNELFGKLASDIAHTAAYMADRSDAKDFLLPFSLDVLNNAPLISPDGQLSPNSTVGSSIRDMVAKVGEKISLRRAVAVAHWPSPQTQLQFALRLASYVHGSVNDPFRGRIGTLALLALKSPHLSSLLALPAFLNDLRKLERSLGRQIVGFDTRCILSPTGAKDETALYDQPFDMFAGEHQGEVGEVLRSWARQHGLVEEGHNEGNGLQVVEFRKWTVGEPLDTNSTAS